MQKGMKRESEKGFTMVELLVVVAISSIIFGAVAITYRTQQRSYIVQEHVAGLQQSLRAAKFLLEKEIREAGCDPNQTAGAGIVTANAISFHFTRDINDGAGTGFPNGVLGDAHEGDANNPVIYSLYDSGDDNDNDLGRTIGAGTIQLAAENIDAIDFIYLDVNENVLNPPDTTNNPPTSTNVPAISVPSIRTVEITLVAKTERPIRGWTDSNTNYFNRRGARIFTTPENDRFRRQLVTTRIKCRNLAMR